MGETFVYPVGNPYLRIALPSQLTVSDLVFLQMLEYYEGILIITSNCIGAFNKAFKSRIQLAISASSLRSELRKKV